MSALRKSADLTGKQIGYWTVIDRAKNAPSGSPMWLCKCECGTERAVLAYPLTHNRTTSCGCRKGDTIRGKKIKHGATSRQFRSPEYHTWRAMKTRCTNPNVIDYKDYGGRGITICAEWMDSFERFLEDMGPRPSSGHSLDRIDVDGNYALVNCKWSTSFEQSHNKRLSKRNKSGYPGVRWHYNKWEASIRSNNKVIYLGSFDDISGAIQARKEAEIKYWGK